MSSFNPTTSTYVNNPSTVSFSDKPQPHASTSTAHVNVVPTVKGNPQLGPEPYFSYPTPSDEQIEEELPPYWENENIPLGPLLDRLARRGYGDMRILVDKTLPPMSSRQKPKHIIEYAKTTRQAVLKYLAILRWKTSVDLPANSSSNPSTINTNGPNANSNQTSIAASFPTPHSNGESNDASPRGYVGKGKGRLTDEDVKPIMLRGKVTDSKRIQVFLEHQNRQHEEAVIHLKHSSKVVESLRERNPDLLTAISLSTTGTYTRLPTSLTETFIPKPPLSNSSILETLQQLNRHLRYRIRCVDYLPPELIVDQVKDGRIYVSGGGKWGWRAEVTVVGFGDVTAENGESRWWLVGVEWGWRIKGDGVDDPGGEDEVDSRIKGKKFTGEERQQILDLANLEALAPRPVITSPDIPSKPPGIQISVTKAGEATETPVLGDSVTPLPGSRGLTADVPVPDQKQIKKVDAPLIRLYNLLQHLSLAYQLETLCSQAVTLSQGRWRGHLLVDMDRSNKVLRIKYWIRPRPPPAAVAPQAPGVGKRPQPPSSLGASRIPMVGGTISITLSEISNPQTRENDNMMREIMSMGRTPSNRVLQLGLGVRWEIGEIGVGGGLKPGDVMENSGLRVDPSRLNLEDILLTATRAHATHLTRLQTYHLIVAPRIALFPLRPPHLVPSESDRSLQPLTLHIPLPSRQRDAYLLVSVSALSGLVEIEDSGAGEGGILAGSWSSAISGKGELSRSGRVKAATVSINEGKSRLVDDVGRLMIAIIVENLENQMRQLGYSPSRRLSIRSQDLAKTDLHPAMTIFVPLPSSSSKLHYFVAKATATGVNFELLKLSRVSAENGIGMKLVVGDRSPLDLAKIRARRGVESGKGKRSREEDAVDDLKDDIADVKPGGMTQNQAKSGGLSAESSFQIDKRDLKDMFIFCNALVAQTIVEQQLKDRAIPYSQQYPPFTGEASPKSSSAVAGMVPTICVNVKDLLKDGRAADVAYPTVHMHIVDWWKGGECQVVTIVRLRHGPSISASGTTPDVTATSSSSSARAEGISFDQATSVVKFRAKDISRCVPAFLEQWERLSKVIVVAGEVNRLNKTEGFKDVKMLSFDLKSATLSYYPGFNVSITYTPLSDSYQVSFFRSSANTPATPAISSDGDPSPHDIVAPLLSDRLNELTSSANVLSRKVPTGKYFIGLLRNTLPLLLEIEAIRANASSEFPALIVRSVTAYRLVWDVGGVRRFALDIILLPSDRYLLRDGSLVSENGEPDLSCGRLSRIDHLPQAVESTYKALRSGKINLNGDSPKGAPPLAMKVDSGRSMICEVVVIGEVLRRLVVAVEGGLGVKRESG